MQGEGSFSRNPIGWYSLSKLHNLIKTNPNGGGQRWLWIFRAQLHVGYFDSALHPAGSSQVCLQRWSGVLRLAVDNNWPNEKQNQVSPNWIGKQVGCLLLVVRFESLIRLLWKPTFDQWVAILGGGGFTYLTNLVPRTFTPPPSQGKGPGNEVGIWQGKATTTNQ